MRTERANAKINVYLNVTARRENGYHDIVSIMQAVSLCDLVTVDFQPSAHTSICLNASGNSAMPLDCRNLAYRAAEAFLMRTEQSGAVKIYIEKRIPMAAGLAGGSADAAAVLRGLNFLSPKKLSFEELCDLGAGLGADVPFCIRGGSARVSGIGERMEEIPSMPNAFLVVACMGEGVSTPWAYGELDRKFDYFQGTPKKDLRPEKIATLWKNGEIFSSAEHFFNLFEEVVPAAQKSVNTVKEEMNRHGAIFSMMSGSGPSVFGIFKNAEDAGCACEALNGMGASAFVCHPCEKFFN